VDLGFRQAAVGAGVAQYALMARMAIAFSEYSPVA
jgi:hypothetical protein